MFAWFVKFTDSQNIHGYIGHWTSRFGVPNIPTRPQQWAGATAIKISSFDDSYHILGLPRSHSQYEKKKELLGAFEALFAQLHKIHRIKTSTCNLYACVKVEIKFSCLIGCQVHENSAHLFCRASHNCHKGVLPRAPW